MAVTTIAAVRGAISVRANRAADIREATARLLEEMIRRNGVTAGKVVSAVFTATPDLTADFPAHAARRPRPGRRGSASRHAARRGA